MPLEAKKEFQLDVDKAIRVSNQKQEYQNWIDAHVRNLDRDRMERNFFFYSGVNNKQWNADALQILQERNQPAHTFNYIQGLVQLIMGQLSQNPFETKFEAISNNLVDEINVLQELYDYDYERGDWEFAKDIFMRDGLIYEGCLKMFKDYKHSKYGNVGLKNLNPAHVVKDPYCQTEDVNDMRGVYTTTWMTAQQIKDSYRKNTEEIKLAIAMSSWNTTDDENVIERACDRSAEFYDSINGLYKVIEFIYTEKVTKRSVVNAITNEKIELFDSDEYQAMSDMNFLASMRIQGGALRMEPEEHTICKIITTCPALGADLILEQGDYPLQLGRLPFVFWSAEDLYGEVQGIVDKLTDAQEVVNKRESVASFILGTAGNNNWLVEADAFSSDGAGIDGFKRDVSKGGQTFEVEPGTNKEGKIRPLDRPAPPNDLWASGDRAQARLPELANITPAQAGFSEGANESALLFNSKREQALSQLELMSKRLKKKDQEIAEMYFYAAKQVYANNPRLINNPDKGDSGINFFINLDVINAYNQVVTMNDIAALPRHSVRITKHKMGETKKREFLSKYIELSRLITNPMLKAMFEAELVKYTDMPESSVEKMKGLADLFIQFQMKQVQLQVATMDQQLAQIQQPQQQQLAQPGEEIEQMGPRQVNQLPGMGNIIDNGIAGGEGAANNAPGRAAPSDIVR